MPADPPATARVTTARPAPRTRRRRAFTLIELIVVVIIIAVLAAIAGLGYNHYADNAKWTALHASAVQLNRAITAKSAHDDYTPRELVAVAATDTSAVAAAGNVIAEPALDKHFAFDGQGYVVTVDDLTTPTAVQLTRWSRSMCLFLGEDVAEAGRITRGDCATATDPGAPDPETDPEGGLTAPENLAATVETTTREVMVSWNPVPGADSYEVCVTGSCAAGSSDWVSTTQPSATFDSLPDGTYTVVVVPRAADGTRGPGAQTTVAVPGAGSGTPEPPAAASGTKTELAGGLTVKTELAVGGGYLYAGEYAGSSQAKLHRMNLETGQVNTLTFYGSVTVTDIARRPSDGHIYYSYFMGGIKERAWGGTERSVVGDFSESPTSLTPTPHAMEFNPVDGLLYVAVSGGKIVKVNPDTGAKTVLRTYAYGGNPTDVAFDPTGIMYITTPSRVQRYDPATNTLSDLVTDKTFNALTYNTRNGFLYGVNESGTTGGGEVVKIDPVTGAQTRIAGGLSQQVGSTMVYDPSGDVMYMRNVRLYKVVP